LLDPESKDARLIAAAPDLFAACEAASDYIERNAGSSASELRDVLDAVRAAIAKVGP